VVGVIVVIYLYIYFEMQNEKLMKLEKNQRYILPQFSRGHLGGYISLGVPPKGYKCI